MASYDIESNVDGTTLNVNASKQAQINLNQSNTWNIYQILNVDISGNFLSFQTTGTTLWNLTHYFGGNNNLYALSFSAATSTGYFAVTDSGGTNVFSIDIGTNTTATYKNTLDDGSGNMTIVGKITTYNNIATAGAGVVAVSAAASETELTTTGATVIATVTPAATGIYRVGAYFRVITAATAVTATVTYDDTTGAQTYTWLSAVSEPVGSYILVSIMISATSSSAISVNFTAGTADQVYATAAIEQLA